MPIGVRGSLLPMNTTSLPAGSNTRSTRKRSASLVSDATNRSEEHTSELQSLRQLVCRLLHSKKKRCSGQTRRDRRKQRRRSRGTRRREAAARFASRMQQEASVVRNASDE